MTRAGGIVLAPGWGVVDQMARAVAEEPVVMWRMRRADGLFSHLLVGCQESGAWAAWFLNDRPLGLRDFGDVGSAIRFSEQMQAQNWSVGWRLVDDR